MALTPTSKLSRIGFLKSGFILLPCKPTVSLLLIGANPSKGIPLPSITRPNKSSPTGI